MARGLLSQRMMLQFKKGVGITKRIEYSEGNEIGSLLTLVGQSSSMERAKQPICYHRNCPQGSLGSLRTATEEIQRSL